MISQHLTTQTRQSKLLYSIALQSRSKIYIYFFLFLFFFRATAPLSRVMVKSTFLKSYVILPSGWKTLTLKKLMTKEIAVPCILINQTVTCKVIIKYLQPLQCLCCKLHSSLQCNTCVHLYECVLSCTNGLTFHMVCYENGQSPDVVQVGQLWGPLSGPMSTICTC